MSLKFGLDWQNYDYVRMRDFQDIMFIENREEKKSSNKRYANNNSAHSRNYS